MSFEALARIRDLTAPSSSALLLLYVLAEYADADGRCYPSQTTLAKRAQLSERAVRANLSLLRKARLIDQAQRRRKDGSRTSDQFTLTFYTPEQAAESAACEVAAKPSRARQTVVVGKRQIQPLIKRLNSTPHAAVNAGLTSFEPVTENISLSARDGRPVAAARPNSFPSELQAVPPEVRDLVVSEPSLGEGWARSWLDLCAFNPIERTLHARSYLARGRIELDLGRTRLREWNLKLGEPLSIAAGAPR